MTQTELDDAVARFWKLVGEDESYSRPKPSTFRLGETANKGKALASIESSQAIKGKIASLSKHP